MTKLEEIKNAYAALDGSAGIVPTKMLNPQFLLIEPEVYGAHDLYFDAKHIGIIGYVLQHDGESLRMSLFGPDSIVDISLVGSRCIGGDKSPFMLTRMVADVPTPWSELTNITLFEPEGSRELLIISGGKADGSPDVQVWMWRDTEQLLTDLWSVGLTEGDEDNYCGLAIDGDDVEHRPEIITPSLCHSWAFKHKLGNQIRRKLRAANYTHSQCFAVFSARSSNIGVSYFEERSGECIQPYEELAQRPERKFVGRSSSWTIGDASPRIKSVAVSGFDFDNDRLASHSGCIFEVFFPWKKYPPNPTYTVSGGGLLITDGPRAGTYRRVYTKDNYNGNHPLGEKGVNALTFKREYVPVEGLVFGMNTMDLGVEEEMTPTEIEEVGKWFAAYVVTQARKGVSLSDEELQVAKDLGVYTGK